MAKQIINDDGPSVDSESANSHQLQLRELHDRLQACQAITEFLLSKHGVKVRLRGDVGQLDKVLSIVEEALKSVVEENPRTDESSYLTKAFQNKVTEHFHCAKHAALASGTEKNDR